MPATGGQGFPPLRHLSKTKTSVPGRRENTAFGTDQRPQWIPMSTSLDSGARSQPQEKPHPNRTHVQLVAVPNRVSLCACPGPCALCRDLGITLLTRQAHRSRVGEGRVPQQQALGRQAGKRGKEICPEQDRRSPQLRCREGVRTAHAAWLPRPHGGRRHRNRINVVGDGNGLLTSA